jgi:anti-anti-sigma factor
VTALELHTKRHDEHLLVSAVGPINRHTLGVLRDHLRRSLAPQGIQVVLDLGECSDVDVDGLLALDVACSVAREHGSGLRLANVSPLIRRMIDQHNLSHLLGTTAAHPAHTNVTAMRDYLRGDTDMAAEVSEGDAYEQQLPVDPREDEPDVDATAHSSESEHPLEANPADVDEQRLIVPLGVAEEDEPTTPQGHTW